MACLNATSIAVDPKSTGLNMCGGCRPSARWLHAMRHNRTFALEMTVCPLGANTRRIRLRKSDQFFECSMISKCSLLRSTDSFLPVRSTMLSSRVIIAAALAAVQALTQTAPGDSQSPTGVIERPQGFQWGQAVRQSLFLAGIEHSFRLTQAKTRRGLRGKFFKDYAQSVTNIHGWGDGDSLFTNYVAHPMQGAVAGFIQIQNDPAGIGLEFGRDGAYWRSRLKSMAWSAAYSTQFEIGPISEATIGNVGKKPGRAGYSDLIVTPVGGLGMTVLEDAVDRFIVARFESTNTGLGWQRFLRVALNPQRSLANLLRLERPWRRDTRRLARTH